MDSGVCERGEALNDDMTHTVSSALLLACHLRLARQEEERVCTRGWKVTGRVCCGQSVQRSIDCMRKRLFPGCHWHHGVLRLPEEQCSGTGRERVTTVR